MSYDSTASCQPHVDVIRSTLLFVCVHVVHRQRIVFVDWLHFAKRSDTLCEANPSGSLGSTPLLLLLSSSLAPWHPMTCWVFISVLMEQSDTLGQCQPLPLPEERWPSAGHIRCDLWDFLQLFCSIHLSNQSIGFCLQPREIRTNTQVF